MKKTRILVSAILIATFIVYVIVTSPSTKTIKISGNATAYNVENQLNKSIPFQLVGTLDKRKNSFIGTLKMDGFIFENTMIANGFSIITYDKAIRTLMGTAYINSDMTKLSFEFNNDQIKIFNTSGTNVLSYPADNLMEAVELNKNLKVRNYTKGER